MVLPAGDQATASTPLGCFSTATDLPLSTSHRRALVSQDTEASRLPSGEKATPRTRRTCPTNLRSSLAVAASHSRTVLSAPAVATYLPSREKTAAPTSSS